MSATSARHDLDDLDDLEARPSPFRAAFGRARVEALSGAGPAFEQAWPDSAGQPRFEYRLVRRRGKRSAEEAAWNALGLNGWELVGVTGKHAAFKRFALGSDASVSR